LANESWFITAPEDLDIWEIMALIARSSLYVGTSLHGYITAFAFGIPRLGLGKIKKLTGFRDTWDLPSMPAGIPYRELFTAATRALEHDPDELERIASDVAMIYRSASDEMWRCALGDNINTSRASLTNE